MIGIHLDLRIERRRIEPAARVRVKCGGMGCIVVYETAEKQPRFSLVEHSGREQIVYQGLKRTNSTAEDFKCACCLCGYVVGCSPNTRLRNQCQACDVEARGQSFPSCHAINSFR